MTYTLDHRVQLQRANFTTNDFNEPVPTWATFFETWAARLDASFGESVRAAEVAATITVHFVIRYSPETATLTPKDRVVLEEGLVYNIVGIRELKRNEWLEMHCVGRDDG